MRRTIWALLLVAIPGCDGKAPAPPEAKTPTTETLPFYTENTFTARWIGVEDPDYGELHTVSDFSYTSQDGRKITKEFLEGRIAVVNWFFTVCQGICPKIMGNVHEALDAFPHDAGVVFLSHSVTPEMDTPEVLRSYAERREITTPRWKLVTGDRKKIYAQARESYFIDQELGVKEANNILHTENVILLDPKGRIRGIYKGTLRKEMKELIEDIRVLKKEVNPDR